MKVILALTKIYLHRYHDLVNGIFIKSSSRERGESIIIDVYSSFEDIYLHKVL